MIEFVAGAVGFDCCSIPKILLKIAGTSEGISTAKAIVIASIPLIDSHLSINFRGKYFSMIKRKVLFGLSILRVAKNPDDTDALF